MTYKEWVENHSQKHKKIIDKLSHLNDSEIIDYFKFENMVIHEPNFCYLYKDNKKCHNIKDLNCYLCACPFFRFDDNGMFKKDEKIVYSICSINSKHSKEFISQKAIHQDCSNCDIPHHKRYIEKNFSRNWSEVIKVDL